MPAGFERDEDGHLVRFPHVGGVVVEAGAEIGANTCVDRGALDDTWIGPGARVEQVRTQVGAGAGVTVGLDGRPSPLVEDRRDAGVESRWRRR